MKRYSPALKVTHYNCREPKREAVMAFSGRGDYVLLKDVQKEIDTAYEGGCRDGSHDKDIDECNCREMAASITNTNQYYQSWICPQHGYKRR